LTRNGCKDASTDPATVTARWRRCPLANVAITTGAPGPDVVDIDVKGGRPGAANFARLRDAGLLRGARAVIMSPSGGWHLYYAGTAQGNSTLPRHGIDFRGCGGYVLAPPSAVDGRPYRLGEHRAEAGTVDWSAIRAYLDPPRPAPRIRPGSRSDCAQLVRWVAALPEGNRNAGLFWASRRAVEIGAGAEVLAALVDAAVSTGLPEPEAVRTAQSARRAGAA